MSFLPKAQSHNSYLVTGLVAGSFVTAGATVDPTVFDGAIRSVQQLDDGAVSFHRVTFDEPYFAGTYALSAQATALLVADDLTTATGNFEADGPGVGPFPAKTDSQIDVLIKNAGTATVAAGRRVDLQLQVKRAGVR